MFLIKSITIPLTLNNVVISECLYRRSSDLKRCKVAGFPIQAFGNDDFSALNSHISSELLRSNNLIVQAIAELQHKLMEQRLIKSKPKQA